MESDDYFVVLQSTSRFLSPCLFSEYNGRLEGDIRPNKFETRPWRQLMLLSLRATNRPSAMGMGDSKRWHEVERQRARNLCYNTRNKLVDISTRTRHQRSGLEALKTPFEMQPSRLWDELDKHYTHTVSKRRIEL